MNQTQNIIRSFVFSKIKTDFDLDHLFSRYSCFKKGAIRPILAPFPKFRENQIFPEHAVFAKMWPLSSFMILNLFTRKLMTTFSIKCEKLRKMALFTTFPQISGKPEFFSKIRQRQFSYFPVISLHAKNQRKPITFKRTHDYSQIFEISPEIWLFRSVTPDAEFS